MYNGNLIEIIKKIKIGNFYEYLNYLYGIVDCSVIVESENTLFDNSRGSQINNLYLINKADYVDNMGYIIDNTDKDILVCKYNDKLLDFSKESLKSFIQYIKPNLNINNLVYKEDNIQYKEDISILLKMSSTKPPMQISIGGFILYLIPKIFGYNKNDIINVSIYRWYKEFIIVNFTVIKKDIIKNIYFKSLVL